jgi:sulfoxide reductase heme-binding subunit YedZ
MSRYWPRRLGRHAALAIASAALLGLVYAGVPSDNALRRWGLATAYVALGWLALSLLAGPWNVLRGRPNPVSQDLRRDIGIWAAILGVAHTIVGLQVHMGGDWPRYFLWPRDVGHFLPVRTDAFGFANYTGLASTLILIGLLALSNDVALRRLGVTRWKSLQRWNYAGFALMAAHGVAYQVMGKRVWPVALAFSVVLLTVLAVQAAGWRAAKR